MNLVIPVLQGIDNSHQVVSALLGDHFLEFQINWNTRFEYWSCDIYESGVALALSLVFNPPTNILNGLNLTEEYGQIVFMGDVATLDNLGLSNSLVWVSNDG